jgi:hypothetical protein
MVSIYTQLFLLCQGKIGRNWTNKQPTKVDTFFKNP